MLAAQTFVWREQCIFGHFNSFFFILFKKMFIIFYSQKLCVHNNKNSFLFAKFPSEGILNNQGLKVKLKLLEHNTHFHTTAVWDLI